MTTHRGFFASTGTPYTSAKKVNVKKYENSRSFPVNVKSHNANVSQNFTKNPLQKTVFKSDEV